MKTKKAIILFSTLILGFFGSLFTPSRIFADDITDVTVSLSDEATNVATDVEIQFTLPTTLTGSPIIELSYEYNSGNGFTGGTSLTNSDVAVSAGTSGDLNPTVNEALNGYLEIGLGTFANAGETLTINIGTSAGGTNQLTTPTTSGNYNWSITIDTDGTEITYDTGAGLAYVADDNDITIIANVTKVIDLELYQAGTTNKLGNPNTVNLGDLSVNSVKTTNYNIGYSTNNELGVTIQVEDISSTGPTATSGGLNKISGTIGNSIICSGTNCNDDGTTGVTAGSEEYGFYISNTGNCGGATANSSYGTQHQAIPTTATTFFSNSAVCDKNLVANHIEVTHAASMADNTAAGSYQQTISYTAYTN